MLGQVKAVPTIRTPLPTTTKEPGFKMIMTQSRTFKYQLNKTKLAYQRNETKAQPKRLRIRWILRIVETEQSMFGQRAWKSVHQFTVIVCTVIHLIIIIISRIYPCYMLCYKFIHFVLSTNFLIYYIIFHIIFHIILLNLWLLHIIFLGTLQIKLFLHDGTLRNINS